MLLQNCGQLASIRNSVHGVYELMYASSSAATPDGCITLGTADLSNASGSKEILHVVLVFNDNILCAHTCDISGTRVCTLFPAFRMLQSDKEYAIVAEETNRGICLGTAFNPKTKKQLMYNLLLNEACFIPSNMELRTIGIARAGTSSDAVARAASSGSASPERVSCTESAKENDGADEYQVDVYPQAQVRRRRHRDAGTDASCSETTDKKQRRIKPIVIGDSQVPEFSIHPSRRMDVIRAYANYHAQTLGYSVCIESHISDRTGKQIGLKWEETTDHEVRPLTRPWDILAGKLFCGERVFTAEDLKQMGITQDEICRHHVVQAGSRYFRPVTKTTQLHEIWYFEIGNPATKKKLYTQYDLINWLQEKLKPIDFYEEVRTKICTYGFNVCSAKELADES